jgi:transposase
MLLSEGQMSDYKGAALMLPAMPRAKELLADKGYDADWLRAALTQRGLAACIPSKSNRKAPIPYDRKYARLIVRRCLLPTPKVRPRRCRSLGQSRIRSRHRKDGRFGYV